MTNTSEIRCIMPKAVYPCCGEDANLERQDKIHPGGQDMHHPAGDLFYAEIIDHEFQMEARGFFCEPCLRAYDLSRNERTSLEERLRDNVARAAVKAMGLAGA